MSITATSAFRFALCSTVHEEEQTYRLRHEVYAEEKGWIPRTPSGIDVDPYDVSSYHFIATTQNDEIVGCVRLIMPSPLGLPFGSATPFPIMTCAADKLCEVSRLAVRPGYRNGTSHSVILFGLCRQIWAQAFLLNREQWCAVIDVPLARMLKILGFRYLYEGDPIEHVGSPSRPVLCSMAETRDTLFAPQVEKLLSPHVEELVSHI